MSFVFFLTSDLEFLHRGEKGAAGGKVGDDLSWPRAGRSVIGCCSRNVYVDNDAVVIGDAKDPKILEARKKVEALQAQAEEALAKLEKDPQADLAYMIQDFGIGELRLATNAINDIMDDKTAAATQRWQRLMIQAKYQWEIDVPFPTTKKGEERPRGEKRNDRIKESLKKYLTASKELLKFF